MRKKSLFTSHPAFEDLLIYYSSPNEYRGLQVLEEEFLEEVTFEEQ